MKVTRWLSEWLWSNFWENALLMWEINFLRSYCNNFQHAIILRIILRLPVIVAMDSLLISNYDAILRLWEVWERSGLWQIRARQIPVSKQFQQKIPFPWSASSSQERLLRRHLHDGPISLLHPVACHCVECNNHIFA